MTTDPPNRPKGVTLWLETLGRVATAITTIGVLIRTWFI